MNSERYEISIRLLGTTEAKRVGRKKIYEGKIITILNGCIHQRTAEAGYNPYKQQVVIVPYRQADIFLATDGVNQYRLTDIRREFKPLILAKATGIYPILSVSNTPTSWAFTSQIEILNYLKPADVDFALTSLQP